GEFSEYDVPTAGAYLNWITAGPDGNLWFTELSAGKIGKLDPAAIPPPTATPTATPTPTASLQLPDLRVSALANPPASVSAGAPFKVTDTTTNFGTAAAVHSTTGYFLSSDRAVSKGDTQIGSRAVPELAPGASSTGSARASVPATMQPGAYFLIACA